jgi:putative ABC transport system permease protein
MSFMREWPQDLRLALRSVRRRPGFAATVILTVAFGIAANTSIFSVVRGVLLRRLPVRDPERLVAVYSREPESDRQPFSIAGFFELQEGTRRFEELVAWCGASANLTGVEEPIPLRAQWTSRGFFQFLGVHAALGRVPSADEEKPGAPKVVLLGDALWRSRFGADPGILGKTLTLNGQPFTVIGVLPRDFIFLAQGADLAAPIVLETDPRRDRRASGFLRVLGRLRPETSAAQATADLDAIVARWRTAFPDADGSKQGVRLVPLTEIVVGSYRRMLLILQAAIALVLAIACVNLANLLLARVAARRPEFALRSALGARRGDLLRQVLAESLVLALLGGLLGLGLAFAGMRLLIAAAPAQLPRASEIGMDGAVLLFNLALSIVAGLSLGLVPALQGSRAPSEGLRGGGRGQTDGKGRARTRALLVATEVGLSLLLLVAAGLLIRTLHRLQSTDPGFDARRLLAVQLSLPKSRYATPEAITAFSQRVTERFESVPGVAGAAAASLNPFTQWKASISFTIVGQPPLDPKETPAANYRAVGARYFHTLGVPVLDGREIGAEDRAETLPVALVSETLARRRFSNGSALNARLRIDDQEPWREVQIVGVVGDVKSTGLESDGTADVYVPYSQTPKDVAVWLANIFCVAVRVQGEPSGVAASLRREVHAIDADVAVAGIRPMEEVLGASLADRRFQTVLLELFAAAALALALSGIYAVTAFSVIERTREIGIRLSLGSGRARILRLLVGQSLVPVASGIVLGAAAALALGRVLSGLLFGVAAHDLRTFVSAMLLVVLVACAASILPAARATRIDPVRALRAD